MARLESGEGDVTLGTLLKAAETYEVRPLDLFVAAASLSPDECLEWAKDREEVRAGLAPKEGRMVVEAAVPRELLGELTAVVSRLDKSASDLEQLRPLVPVFTALVAALGEGYEDSVGRRELDGLRRALESSSHSDE
jgi:hypothetical protein